MHDPDLMRLSALEDDWASVGPHPYVDILSVKPGRVRVRLIDGSVRVVSPDELDEGYDETGALRHWLAS